MIEKPSKSERLREHLMSVIEQGLEPHSKLPTERELATEFDVNRLTVRRALDRMESEDLIYRVQGAGTFVAASRITKSVELTSFTEDMEARGLVPGSSVLISETSPAGSHVASKLRISPAAEIYHIRRIRTADGKPMCLEDSFLNPEFVPGLIAKVDKESLYNLMERDYRVRIEWAEQTIRATVLDPDEAQVLEAPAFSPAFLVTRTGYDAKDRAIEHAESLYRGDRYHYELQIRRQ
jgi:GntR family transcriptional regulator